MVVSVRRAVPGDEDRLGLVAQSAFLETFAGILNGDDIVAHCARAHAPSVYAAWLQDAAVDIWIAETADGAGPVGYLVLAPSTLAQSVSGDLEVKRVYMLHRFHGGGIGSRLMDLAIDAAKARGAKRLLLGVYADNSDALAFYTKHRFGQIGTRRFRVGANDYDDVVLARELDG